MLWYIIDGWNLANSISELEKDSEPHLNLLRYLKAKRLTGSSNNKVTVVFDGMPKLGGTERDIEVIFSQAQSADDIIKQTMTKSQKKKQMVVVSDDREIRDCARSLGVRIMRCGDFVKTKQKKRSAGDEKNISYRLQREITEELRKKWLNE